MKVLITGGSRGIGKAIATELSKDGHDLFLVSKNSKCLKDTINDLKKIYRNNIQGTTCDLMDESAILNLKLKCEKKDFSPDILVLNAGIFIEGSLIDSNSSDFYKTMSVNLFHIYHCVKAFIASLKKSSYARIIIIGSTASLESYPVGPLYGVSKWSVKGYSINLRKELMNMNIGVTLVNPGGTWTDLWNGEELPIDRLLEASDIGKIVSNILTLSSQAVVEEIIIRPILGDFHN